MTSLTPVPLSPADPAIPNFNSGSSQWQVSGGCDASAVSGTVQDWYWHSQGYRGMYERNEQWTDCTTSKAGPPNSPRVSFNYVDIRVDAWTDDKIIYNTTFSACSQIVQTIDLRASGSCSATVSGDAGWGLQGQVLTSGTGLILRPVRKAANGTILDPTGFCSNSFNMELGTAPGAYDCSSGWDTLGNVKSDLSRLHNEITGYCETFNPDLVDI